MPIVVYFTLVSFNILSSGRYLLQRRRRLPDRHRQHRQKVCRRAPRQDHQQPRFEKVRALTRRAAARGKARGFWRGKGDRFFGSGAFFCGFVRASVV